LDLSLAVKSSSGCFPRTRRGTVDALQYCTARRACRSRENPGARARISLRVEVFVLLCRRATAQSDHQPQQGAPIPAAVLHGMEQTASPLAGKPDSQQGPAMAVGPVLGGLNSLSNRIS